MFSMVSFRKHYDEKKENNLLILIIKMQILFARTTITSTACASFVFPSSYSNMIFNQSVHIFSYDCNSLSVADCGLPDFPLFWGKKTIWRKKKSQRGKHSHPTQPLAQGLDLALIVQFQKISILPPQKGLEFPGGWGGGVLEDQQI